MKKKKALTIIKHWLPIAIASTTITMLIYLTVQQSYRMSANDPQIQLAEDMATRLSQGIPTSLGLDQNLIDIKRSLMPFVILYDETGKVSSTLVNDVPALPQGVFQKVKQDGEQRFTWQPEPGIRIAAIVTHFNGQNSGFVLAGRSLREVEKREDMLLLQIAIGWIGTLLLTLLSTFLFLI